VFKLYRFAIILCVLGAIVSWSQVARAQGTVIRQILVEGAQRIEPETVQSYLLIQPGDSYDPSRVNRSLKSLFSTGLFADVSIRMQGPDLVVSVSENPVINRIAFEGNQKIENEALSSEVTLRPRVIYTRSKVQDDVQRILTLYRRSGRFAATVEPKVIRLEQNRVDLVFEINEGPLTEIASIRFIGNKEFSDGKLKDVIQTKESRWYRVFSSDDSYDPDRLAFDRELLRRYYLREGYADFNVVSSVAELQPNKEAFFVTFVIEEGPRYEFGTVDLIAGLRNLKKEEVADIVEIETGDWYDNQVVDKTVEDLSAAVSELGHTFVDVRPRINRDRENRKIDVAFDISEGPRIFVERIDIKGNARTEDEVIRREFKLVEGDGFSTAKLRRSRQRIEGLQYFSKVSVEQIPGSAPDKTVISVEVEEKSTGSVSIGAGYSTTLGPLADFGIQESNLLGRGQRLGLNARIAGDQSQLDLKFTEPYFLDRELAAGFDLFHKTQDLGDTSSYESEETGGGLRMSYPITEKLRQAWGYKLTFTDITNVDSGASSFIKSQEGSQTLSVVSHSLIYDNRDSTIGSTKEGYVVGLTNELAGLGGTHSFIRDELTASYYYPVLDEVIFKLSGGVGHITGLGKDVAINQRFFLGGDNLRGFQTSGVGPRASDSDDALGGEFRYLGTAEVRFPLGFPDELKVTGKLFADMGSLMTIHPQDSTVQDTGSLRASVGTGINWESPFGPIGVDFGFPVVKESFDKTETIRVNFGTRF